MSCRALFLTLSTNKPTHTHGSIHLDASIRPLNFMKLGVRILWQVLAGSPGFTPCVCCYVLGQHAESLSCLIKMDKRNYYRIKFSPGVFAVTCGVCVSCYSEQIKKTRQKKTNKHVLVCLAPKSNENISGRIPVLIFPGTLSVGLGVCYFLSSRSVGCVLLVSRGCVCILLQMLFTKVSLYRTMKTRASITECKKKVLWLKNPFS